MRNVTARNDICYDACVIGAGISGMSFAHYARRAGLRVLVIEKGSEPGGCLASVPVYGTGEAKGWLELGAHTCYNSYVEFLKVIDDLGFLGRIATRRGLAFKILSEGNLRSIGSCLNMWELFRSAPHWIYQRRTNQTVGSFYSKVLGSGNLRRVFLPVLNAVASQDVRDFPADALLKFRRQRRRDVRRSFAIRGGLQSVVCGLADRGVIECSLESEVASLCTENDRFVLRTTQAKAFKAKWVAVATPVDEAARLLEGDFPTLGRLLGRVEVRRIRSVGIVVRNRLASVPRIAGIVMADNVEGPCFSAVAGDTFLVPGKRSFAFHFRENSCDEATALQYACDVLRIPQGDVESVHIKEQCMPAIRSGHAELVQQVDRESCGTRLSLLGNYFGGLAIEDCVFRSQKQYGRMAAALNRGRS